MNYAKLAGHVEALVERRCVRFSKPALGLATRRDPPARFSTGGLRHHGEWIATCALVDRAARVHHGDRELFYSSGTGRKFIRALEARMCSLSGTQLLQVLLAARRFQAPVEDTVLRELQHQLHELETLDLLRIATAATPACAAFRQRLSEELAARSADINALAGEQARLAAAMIASYRS